MNELKFLNEWYYELKNEEKWNEYIFERKQKIKFINEHLRTILTDQYQLKNKK